MHTYWDYNGRLRCPTCDFAHVITFSSGNVLGMKPLIDEKYMIMESHSILDQPLGDYEQAVNCLSVQAWKACAVMARRAIQGALLACGVDDARPQKMIDDARNKHGLLEEKQHRLAATVTFFGGKGAHPGDDEINRVGEIEAANGLWVTKTLLLALFPPSADQVNRPPLDPRDRFGFGSVSVRI